MSTTFLAAGAINAALAVLFGAFGSHGLKQRLTVEMLEIFQTAVQYHFYHALGLLAVGFFMIHYPESSYGKWAGWAMLAGIIIFSGSLYILSMSGVRWLGAITPIGGTAFILSWVLLALAAFKS